MYRRREISKHFARVITLWQQNITVESTRKQDTTHSHTTSSVRFSENFSRRSKHTAISTYPIAFVKSARTGGIEASLDSSG
jgi:hypothetical protein